MGRAELVPSRFWPAWIFGTACLSAAKILENMEIGHNVMHGQWDWMNNPEIHSSSWDWDTASTKEAWKHSHNYVHHTYTNIRGKDKDLGYEIMRIDPHQKWHPVYLLQPVYNVVLMALFEWGVAFHDLDFEAIRKGEKSKEQVREELKGIAGKARAQIVKDYIAFPALSGLIMGGIAAATEAARQRRAPRRRVPAGLRGRLPARLRRKVPQSSPGRAVADACAGGVQALLPLDAVGRRDREHRPQLLVERDHLLRPLPRPDLHVQPGGGRGRDQGRLVRAPAARRREHRRRPAVPRRRGQPRHTRSSTTCIPDMPSTRYGEIAPKVRDVCKRYGLPYNTGPFRQQWGSVQRTILRLAFPGGKPRPKPGPYEGTDTQAAPAAASRNGAGASNGAAANGDRGKPAATENVPADGPADDQ